MVFNEGVYAFFKRNKPTQEAKRDFKQDKPTQEPENDVNGILKK